jgi:hypothetical protein
MKQALNVVLLFIRKIVVGDFINKWQYFLTNWKTPVNVRAKKVNRYQKNNENLHSYSF